MIRLLLVALAAIVVIVFTAANMQVVELKTIFFDGVRASLAFLMFVAFAGGFALAILFLAHQSIRRRLRDRAQERRQQQAESALLPPPPQILWPAPAGGKRRVSPE